MSTAQFTRVQLKTAIESERTDDAVHKAWRAVDMACLMPADCLRQPHNRQALIEMRLRIERALGGDV
jgi:hypothetical protein